MELIRNWFAILMAWVIMATFTGHKHAHGLRCYACFYDEVTGLGHTCERPNNREYFTDCKSKEDVDNALKYIGVEYEAQKKARLLEQRRGQVQEIQEEEPQFACVIAHGDFQSLKLGTGILRSCWQLPKFETPGCRDLKLFDRDETTYDGCYCDRNHHDGQPCNGEHKFSPAEEGAKFNLSIQERYAHVHDNDEEHEDDGDDVFHHAKSHAESLNSASHSGRIFDYLLYAVFIVVMIVIVELILIRDALMLELQLLAMDVPPIL